nr:MAG: polymerase PB2 [Xinjiang sediment orthomyxo-like virus 2]
MESTEEMKKILLKICKRVCKADSESIKILQSQPLCNFRGIVRSSKNTKDPNPLSSMQVLMSRKYPISVDAEKAREKRMPNEFFSEKDCHQYGRVIAKREALTWYMDNAQVPDDETKKAIDILFKEHRDAVVSFNSYDWRNSFVSVGPVALVRDRIPLREVTVHIPKYARTQYLMAALLPNHVLDWDSINPLIMESFRSLMNLKTTNKISIASQIALLDSALEPKWRVLPILPEMDRTKNRIRHVFCSNQWVVRGYTDRSVKSKQSFIDKTLQDLGEACAFIIYKGINPEKMTQMLSTCQVYNQNLKEALSNFASRETIYVKLLKSLVGKEITKESTIGDIVFCPCQGEVIQIQKENSSGTPYTVYEGQEIVLFKHHEYRGSFSHSGTVLSIIDMPMMDLSVAAHIVGCIAAYCRYSFHSTKGKNLLQMQGEVIKKVSLTPWVFLECTKKEWHSRQAYKWKVVPEASYSVPPLYRAKPRMIKGSLKLCFVGGFNIRVHPPKFKRISGEVTGINEYLIEHLPPGLELEHRYYFYINNRDILLDKIDRHDYNWCNKSIVSGIPVAKQLALASTCRAILSALIKRSPENAISVNILAVFYLFAHTEYVCPELTNVESHEFVWHGSITIDLRFTKGFFRMENNEMIVNNKSFCNADTPNPEERLKLLFPGFDIIPRDSTNGLRMVSAGFTRQSSWDSSVRYGIMIGADIFEIKRNILREVEVARTIRRALQPKTIEEILQSIGIAEEPVEQIDPIIVEEYDDWNDEDFEESYEYEDY